MAKLTLGEVQEGLKRSEARGRAFSLEDFIDADEVAALHEEHRKRQGKKRKAFDEVDSVVAEIIARFGWQAYEKWNSGEVDDEWMARLLCAERARETQSRTEIISTIYKSVLGTVSKHPKSNFESVAKILEANAKIMKGEL